VSDEKGWPSAASLARSRTRCQKATSDGRWTMDDGRWRSSPRCTHLACGASAGAARRLSMTTCPLLAFVTWCLGSKRRERQRGGRSNADCTASPNSELPKGQLAFGWRRSGGSLECESSIGGGQSVPMAKMSHAHKALATDATPHEGAARIRLWTSSRWTALLRRGGVDGDGVVK